MRHAACSAAGLGNLLESGDPMRAQDAANPWLEEVKVAHAGMLLRRQKKSHLTVAWSATELNFNELRASLMAVVTAGFAVGVAEKSQIIDGSKVAEGDILLGLASSGIHSNGYSLVRRVFSDYKGEEELPELEGKKLKDVLLEPTRIYVKAVLPLVKAGLVNGIAHITGGGFVENVPRMFSDDLAAEIQEDKVPVLPIFKALEKYGDIKHDEMFEIFNMGIGLMFAVKPENVSRVKELLDEEVYELGHIIEKQAQSVVIK